MKKKKSNQKLLTFEKLLEYHQKVLAPELEEKFITKNEFNNFKNKIYTDIDKLSKKIEKKLILG